MVELEKGQRIIALNQATSGVFGAALLAPRGALALRIDQVEGSFTIASQVATSSLLAVALIRRVLDSTLGTIEGMAGMDLIVSKVVSNADLGSPTDSSQWNSFDLNKIWDNDEDRPSIRDKPAAAQVGFQMIIEFDGTALNTTGLFRIDYTIIWPNSVRTRDLGRIRRMGMMN